MAEPNQPLSVVECTVSLWRKQLVVEMTPLKHPQNDDSRRWRNGREGNLSKAARNATMYNTVTATWASPSLGSSISQWSSNVTWKTTSSTACSLLRTLKTRPCSVASCPTMAVTISSYEKNQRKLPQISPRYVQGFRREPASDRHAWNSAIQRSNWWRHHGGLLLAGCSIHAPPTSIPSDHLQTTFIHRIVLPQRSLGFHIPPGKLRWQRFFYVPINA